MRIGKKNRIGPKQKQAANYWCKASFNLNILIKTVLLFYFL